MQREQVANPAPLGLFAFGERMWWGRWVTPSGSAGLSGSCLSACLRPVHNPEQLKPAKALDCHSRNTHLAHAAVRQGSPQRCSRAATPPSQTHLAASWRLRECLLHRFISLDGLCVRHLGLELRYQTSPGLPFSAAFQRHLPALILLLPLAGLACFTADWLSCWQVCPLPARLAVHACQAAG